jgi:hypothetical protein
VLRTFEDYMRLREEMDTPFAPEMPNTDSGRWDAATGGTENYKQKQAFEILFEIARIAVKKMPQRILTFFKSLQDDEIQEKLKYLENEGLWNSIKGRGGTEPRNDMDGLNDDGLERVVPNAADSMGDGEEI